MDTKIYLIEFNEYADDKKNKVYNKKRNKTIEVMPNGFLAREEHLDYLKEYGNGIKSAVLIGKLFEFAPPDYSYLMENPIIRR